MMIEKIIVVAPTTAVPISTGLAVALNVLTSPVVFFQQQLRPFKIGDDIVVPFEFGFDIGNLFDQAQFVDTLSVVGHGAI